MEFVSHITCAFAHSTQPGRVARAAEATVNMGSKVGRGHGGTPEGQGDTRGSGRPRRP